MSQPQRKPSPPRPAPRRRRGSRPPTGGGGPAFVPHSPRQPEEVRVTDDRPAQPGPPGDPPNPPGGPPSPPGGRSVEERVAVVETRLDDLPTKGDLAEGLAKSDRRVGKRIDALSISVGERIDALGESMGKRIDALGESVGKRIDALGVALGKQISDANLATGKRIDALNTSLGERLDKALQSQALIYIGVTSLVLAILFGISGSVGEWRDEQRQKVVEDVQQVQKAQGETLDRLQQTQERQGEALDRLQHQVGLLVEHLLGGRGAEPEARGQEPGRQEPQGGGLPPVPESESAPKKLEPPQGQGGGGGAE